MRDNGSFPADAMGLARATIARDRRALARLLTLVENRWSGWLEAMTLLYPSTGRARVIGVTGSAGAGKSTLIGALAQILASQGHHPAIVAIDPSSPLSGGAVLGDRIRMTQSMARGVFIRSLATRGAMGGLCQSACDVVRVLDAAGHDVILVETVGVGQDEVDIMRLAQTVLVVCTPGQGDAIQTIKAGLMEIASVFVLNKADAPGTAQLDADLRTMLSIRSDSARRNTPIFRTVASTGEGVPELVRGMMSMSAGAHPDQGNEALTNEILRQMRPAVQAKLARLTPLERANPYSVLQSEFAQWIDAPPS